MPFRSDVNVNTAPSGGIALGTGLAENADDLLQLGNVIVGEDGCDHLAFFIVKTVDADILLEFPFPPLGIPCAPSAVAVAVGGVLVVFGSKEGGCQLGCFGSCDVVHLDLNADGLLFHFCNLGGGLFVHGMDFLSSVFSLSVVTYSL